MNTRRLLSIVCVVLAASSLALGSTGFSSVSAERNVAVEVVDQQDAYVGVVACAKSTRNEGNANPVHVWVTNRFTETATVERIVGDDSHTYTPPRPQQAVEPGQEVRFEANFATHSVTVHIGADGLDAEVTALVHSKQICPVHPPSNGMNRAAQGTTTTITTTTTTNTTTTTG